MDWMLQMLPSTWVQVRHLRNAPPLCFIQVWLNGHSSPFPLHLLCYQGVLAGVAATSFTQPFDMLKTRMQLKPLVYRNLWSSAKKVIAVRLNPILPGLVKVCINMVIVVYVQEEGAIGFFDGMAVRLVRKSLNSAVSWTIYEEIIRWHRNSQLNASAL